MSGFLGGKGFVLHTGLQDLSLNQTQDDIRGPLEDLLLISPADAISFSESAFLERENAPVDFLYAYDTFAGVDVQLIFGDGTEYLFLTDSVDALVERGGAAIDYSFLLDTRALVIEGTRYDALYVYDTFAGVDVQLIFGDGTEYLLLGDSVDAAVERAGAGGPQVYDISVTDYLFTFDPAAVKDLSKSLPLEVVLFADAPSKILEAYPGDGFIFNDSGAAIGPVYAVDQLLLGDSVLVEVSGPSVSVRPPALTYGVVLRPGTRVREPELRPEPEPREIEIVAMDGLALGDDYFGQQVIAFSIPERTVVQRVRELQMLLEAA